MARLKSRAVGGYFATPPHLIPRIAAMIECKVTGRHPRWSFVDPCAGDGAALVSLARELVGPAAMKTQVRLYAAELERGRARRLDAMLRASVPSHAAEVLHGDAMRVVYWNTTNPAMTGISDGIELLAKSHSTHKPNQVGAGVLYLNPPYDTDPLYVRLEERFLRCWTPVLALRGALVFVVPYRALAASADTLATHFEDVRVVRFPRGADWDAFGQVVVIARRAPALGAPDAAMAGMLRRWAEDPSGLAELPTVDEARAHPSRLVVTPSEYAIQSWKLRALDPARLTAEYAPWGASRGHDAAAEVRALPGIVPDPAGAASAQSFPLAVVPKPAHIASAVAAGLFNGSRVEPSADAARDLGLPPLLVKGSFDRPWRSVAGADKVNTEGEKVSEQQVQRPALVITVFDLATARYHTLTNATEITHTELGERLAVENLSVGDLIRHYGASLLQTMRERCPVLHDAGDPAHAIPLGPMARTPFEAQRQSIMALVKVLRENGAAIALAEVGTGKTTLACGVAATQGARRILVMCPPHLLESWQKEVAVCLPDARVVVLDDVGDVERLAADTSPGVVFGVVSREMAKLGHAWDAVSGSCPRCGAEVPVGDHAKRRATCKATSQKPGNAYAHIESRLATALALEPANALEAASVKPHAVRDLIASRVVQRALAMRDKGTLTQAIRGRWNAAWTRDAHPSMGREGRLLAVAHALIPLYTGDRDRPYVAQKALDHVYRALATPEARAAVVVALWRAALTMKGNGPYSPYCPRTNALKHALKLLALVAPDSPASREAESEMARASSEPGVAQVHGITMDPAGGTIDVVSKRRAGLLAGEVIDIATHTHNGARYSASQMETLGWSRIARHYSGTAAPTNPLWHASQALDALRDASVWYAGEACGERLYAAIPEPRRYPVATFIARRFPKLFDLVVLDEIQELTTDGSAQERAAHRLAGMGAPTLALTGSIMNGYAESLFTTLWYLSRGFGAVYHRSERRRFVEDAGYRRRVVSFVEKKSGKAVPYEFGAVSDRVDRKEREMGDAPGVLPVAVLRYLLPVAVTMSKDDLKLDLPPFDEHPVEIEPDEELLRAHAHLQSKLLEEIKRSRFDKVRAGKLFGALSELPSHPDRATCDTGNVVIARGERIYEIHYPKSVGGEIVASVRGRAASDLLPKERWLLDTIERELSEGRRVCVAGYHEDVLPRLARIISARIGEPVPLLLSGKVPTAKRQSWIEREVIEKGRRVMVVNPVVVQTGLNNLVWFSTTVWMQNPACNPLVKRQFEGRFHRIGARLPVRSYFPVYSGTTQVPLRQLLADKVVVSMAVDGLDVEGALAAAGAVELDTSAGFGVGRQLYKMLTGEAA